MDGMNTQNAQILAYMANGNWISPLDALAKFKCFRLGGRIYEIARMLPPHLAIVKRWKVLSSGKRIKEYTIALKESA